MQTPSEPPRRERASIRTGWNRKVPQPLSHPDLARRRKTNNNTPQTSAPPCRATLLMTRPRADGRVAVPDDAREASRSCRRRTRRAVDGQSSRLVLEPDPRRFPPAPPAGRRRIRRRRRPRIGNAAARRLAGCSVRPSRLLASSSVRPSRLLPAHTHPSAGFVHDLLVRGGYGIAAGGRRPSLDGRDPRVLATPSASILSICHCPRAAASLSPAA